MYDFVPSDATREMADGYLRYYEQLLLTTLETGVVGWSDEKLNKFSTVAYHWAKTKECRGTIVNAHLQHSSQVMMAQLPEETRLWIMEELSKSFMHPTNSTLPGWYHNTKRHMYGPVYDVMMDILEAFAGFKVVYTSQATSARELVRGAKRAWCQGTEYTVYPHATEAYPGNCISNHAQKEGSKTTIFSGTLTKEVEPTNRDANHGDMNNNVNDMNSETRDSPYTIYQSSRIEYMLYYERFMLAIIESGLAVSNAAIAESIQRMARSWARMKAGEETCNATILQIIKKGIVRADANQAYMNWYLEHASVGYVGWSGNQEPHRSSTSAQYVSVETYIYEMQILSLYAENKVRDRHMAICMHKAAVLADETRRLDNVSYNTGIWSASIAERGFVYPRQLWSNTQHPPHVNEAQLPNNDDEENEQNIEE